jgi:hypothetical protein
VVPTEYRADLVVLLLEGKPCYAIVVEVQLSEDLGKHMSWPAYIVNLRARVNCPTALLVVAPEPAVARWCARPIETGHPNFALQPLVLGPQAIPVIQDEQRAREVPELVVLSAIAHGREAVGVSLAPVVLAAVAGLEDERSRLYFDLAWGSMNAAARSALEAVMLKGTYEYQSDFARKYVAQGMEEGRKLGLEEGREEGRKAGREEGREEGREQGREQGREEGEREALFEVLSARGLTVDAAERQRILACTDLSQLKRWLRRAVSAQATHELFAP